MCIRDRVRDDIIDILQLQNPVMLTTGFDRKNLYFAVETPKDRYAAVSYTHLDVYKRQDLYYRESNTRV